MTIEIDDKSGFCFGVVRAINTAESILASQGRVHCLGDIVHNMAEVDRLGAMGMQTVSRADLDRLAGQTVLIRAHGEPPVVYDKAEANGITLVDATCPVVASLQKTVKSARRLMDETNGQVVILGKRGHAEVVGLTGQVDERAIVVENSGDLDQIDFARPIYLLSQTTQSLQLFGAIRAEILARAADPAQVTVHDTVCRHVSNREPHLREFAARFDTVVFVSGRKSSNGQLLYDTCRRVNPRTHKIEQPSELRREWFDGCTRVGICGATSTPKWLMEEVAAGINALVAAP